MAADDITGKLGSAVAVAVPLPAVWMLSAITVVLFGLLLRFTPVAWLLLIDSSLVTVGVAALCRRDLR